MPLGFLCPNPLVHRWGTKLLLIRMWQKHKADWLKANWNFFFQVTKKSRSSINFLHDQSKVLKHHHLAHISINSHSTCFCIALVLDIFSLWKHLVWHDLQLTSKMSRTSAETELSSQEFQQKSKGSHSLTNLRHSKVLLYLEWMEHANYMPTPKLCAEEKKSPKGK